MLIVYKQKLYNQVKMSTSANFYAFMAFATIIVLLAQEGL